jgi:UDP-N-acetylmuramyl pentapeptide phosphotransferase/UDP-N-acetylglucosamine-1-phosphate transferase
MFGIGTLPLWFSIVFSTFVFIALINCFNLLDGIDGLASGMGIVISLIFGFWLFSLGFLKFSILSFALAGGLMSFYRFNVFGGKNKLFMGDTGSLLLGFLFAVLAIKVMCCELPSGDELYMRSLPTVVMGVMIIPIIDTIRVFTLRMLRGKSPFSADRTHLHHVFLQLGFSHLQASSTIIAVNLILFCLTLFMRNMNPVVSTMILFSSALIVSLIPCYLARNLSPKVKEQFTGSIENFEF